MKNILFNKISNYKIIGYKKLNCKLKNKINFCDKKVKKNK